MANLHSEACRPLLALLTILLLTPATIEAAANSRSEEVRACLMCHGRSTKVKTFENGQTIPVAVNAATFRASAHGTLGCTSCHTEFSNGQHPDRPFKSILHYQTRSSLTCRSCHADEQIKKSTLHASLLDAELVGKPALCVNCHGSHTIPWISARRTFASEENFCMRCHERPMDIHFRNGSTKRLSVDGIELEMSVHGKLSCSDCHFGFTTEEHPKRNFMTARDLSIASSESCRRCHFDKYTKTLESIHYSMLSRGNTGAPVCTDCHGSHAISRVSRDRATSAQRCQRCHAGVYLRYAQSVHGSALLNERNQDVPVCIDCHTAHTIADPFSTDYREHIPETCSSCHARKEIMAKYGLSTDVVKTYLSDFHGVTLDLYKRQKDGQLKPPRPIAVCTDCHGTHSIMRTAGPGSLSVKSNLLQRCQKCHPDATEHFPEAWLSHYEPSLQRTPLVFLAGIVYKAFIPLLIAGLVLQILLHIWRYAVNR